MKKKDARRGGRTHSLGILLFKSLYDVSAGTVKMSGKIAYPTLCQLS